MFKFAGIVIITRQRYNELLHKELACERMKPDVIRDAERHLEACLKYRRQYSREREEVLRLRETLNSLYGMIANGVVTIDRNSSYPDTDSIK